MAWPIFAVVGAAAVGAAAVASPIAGLAVAVAVCGLIAAGSLSRSSSVATYSVVVALLILTIFPRKLFGDSALAQPEVTKVILLICWLGAAMMRGLVLRALAPALVMVPLALISHSFGKPLPQLTSVQSVSSLVTLSLAWAFLAIRWRRSDAVLILRWLTYMAPISVGLGILLDAAGLISLYRGAGEINRLAGASIAALLGGIGAFGIGASVTLAVTNIERRRATNVTLFVVNWGIVYLTASRGPLLIALVLSMPWVIQFLGRQARGNAQVAAIKIAASLAVVATAAALVVPSLQARNETQSYNATTGTVSTDPTSGRLTAWKEFVSLANQSPVFGLGVGAGPVAQIAEAGFQAQHNEYIRAYLETGAFGLGALLIAAAFAFSALLRRVPKGPGRGLLKWQIFGFAVYSLTDNTLSSPYLAVPFMTLFAATAAALHVAERRAPRRSPLPAVPRVHRKALA